MFQMLCYQSDVWFRFCWVYNNGWSNLIKFYFLLRVSDNICSDLLTNNPEIADVDKDDLTLLNEILDIPTSTSAETLTANPSEFNQQWLSSFDSSESTSAVNNTSSPLASLEASNEFMPSHLLDMQSDLASMDLKGKSCI